MKKNTLLTFVFILYSLFFPTHAVASMSETNTGFFVPGYGHRINDYANVLSDDLETEFNEYLNTYSKASDGADIALITIASTSGEPIASVAAKIYDEWKLGQENNDLDDGILFVLDVKDSALEIKVGEDVKSKVDDIILDKIVNEDFLPEMHKGNFEMGVTKGLNNYLVALQNPEAFDYLYDKPVVDFAIYMACLFFATIVTILMTIIFAMVTREQKLWLSGVFGFLLGLYLSDIAAAIFFAILGASADYYFKKFMNT